MVESSETRRLLRFIVSLIYGKAMHQPGKRSPKALSPKPFKHAPEVLRTLMCSVSTCSVC